MCRKHACAPYFHRFKSQPCFDCLCSQVTFNISVTSQGCPKQGKPETIKIKPLGFTEEVEITLNFICECECHKKGVAHSEDCHFGNGTYECGACK